MLQPLLRESATTEKNSGKKEMFLKFLPSFQEIAVKHKQV